MLKLIPVPKNRFRRYNLYPAMKTFTNCKFYLLFFLFAAFSVQLFAQGKKIYVGTGSGFIDYPTAQATLNLQDEDTVVINPGVYKLMNFRNITASAGHKIYIINSGLVEFTDPTSSQFSNLSNVEIKGNGTPGIDYGFYMHDLIRGISIDGNMSGVYFSYIKMANIADYAIYISNQAHVYDGTNNGNSLFYDLKFLHFSATNLATSFMQVGTFNRILEDGVINMTRKLEVGYCDISNAPLEDLIHLNKVVNANIHHNKFTHVGINNRKHSCMVYIYGNGDVHHNYINDYWGSGTRLHAFSLDDIGAINVYDNVMTNSMKYSGVEAKATEAEDLASNPNLHYVNFKIYNNTFGNLSAYDWSCAMIDTYYFLGGTIEIKNNLGFNIQRDKPYDPTWNYVYQGLNIGIPDTSNNLYNPSYLNLGLADDVVCMLNVNSIAIDRGLNLSSLVTDDIDGIARPQGMAFDLGAHEYQTGVIYPVANAGADTSTQLPTDSIRLNGTASYNPGGGVLTYKWTQVSGPSAAVFLADNIVTPVLKNLVAGTYQLKLTVTNDQGHSNEDIVALLVKPKPVFPPVANAGGTTTITLPVNSAALNGAASSNPAGGVLKYLWTKNAGPASYSITGDTTAAPTVGNLTEGTYQFKLTVTNADGLSSTDIATVQVLPAPVPVANAGADVNLVLPANSSTLNGSASTTPAGGALTYAWTKVSGPASFTITGENTATPSISNLAEGVYQVKLVVTNIQGLSAEDQVTITVSTVPLVPPLANAGADINITLPVNTATLDGTASSNAAGGALTYAWTLVSGPGSFSITGDNTATPVVSNLTQGSYQLKLKVTNTQGLSAEDIVIVNVSAMAAPVAAAGSDLSIVLPANSATLDASGSYQPGGGALSYAWSKISGPDAFTIAGAATATPTVSNLAEGVYQLQLTVTNSGGLSGTDIIVVTVNQALLSVPNAGKDTTINFPGGYAILDGSGSFSTGGTNIVNYHWQQTSGPTTAFIKNSELSKTTATNLEPGVYVFQLTVTDNYGRKETSTMKVTVISTMRNNKKITLYPNPCADNLNVRILTDSTGSGMLRITSLSGIPLITQQFDKSQLMIDVPVVVTRLPAGLYIVEVIIGKEVQLLGKFVKR